MNVRSRITRQWATAIALACTMAPALLAAQPAEPPALASLIARVRAARIRNDSAVRAYDAAVRSRFSIGFGFRTTGRERLFGRVDHAYRVMWRQALLRGGGVGATLLDGLIRLDWARGLAPVERTRIDVSMDVRF